MWPCIVTNFFLIRPTRCTIFTNLQLSSRSICSGSKAVYKPVWHIPLLSVQWINSWWWTEELSETSRVSWQNKFVKLVHLVGFIIKKSVEIFSEISKWEGQVVRQKWEIHTGFCSENRMGTDCKRIVSEGERKIKNICKWRYDQN
jgi:hypothetical protein